MSEACPNEAGYVRFWPGREPDFVCEDHKEDTEAIVAVLFPVLSLPDLLLPLLKSRPPPPCSCTAGRVQRVMMKMNQ